MELQRRWNFELNNGIKDQKVYAETYVYTIYIERENGMNEWILTFKVKKGEVEVEQKRAPLLRIGENKCDFTGKI